MDKKDKLISLFVDLVPEDKQHQHYKLIKNDKYIKEVLDSWIDEQILNRDGKEKFIKEFQTEFNSVLWELYIYQCLKKMGCKFNMSYEHPDYVVSNLYQSFLIECTIANNAIGDIPEYDVEAKLNGEFDIDEMVYKQVLRLSNSFNSKYQKYLNSYRKEEWVQDKPYIIAIEPFEQPNGFCVGNEAILAVLYGQLFNRHSENYQSINSVIKANNSSIPLGFFRDSKYKEVSAVLFSQLATIGKVDAVGNDPNCIFSQLRYDKNGITPKHIVSSRMYGISDDKENEFYREKLTDGLFCYLNPLAEHPLKRQTIKQMYDAGISIFNINSDFDDLDNFYVHDNFLIHRLVEKINPY